MKQPKILVLSQHDSPAKGHGYSLWKELLDRGYDACFLPYLSRYTDDSPLCFVDAHNKWNWSWRWYCLTNRFKKKYKTRSEREQCALFNTSFHYNGDAKKILRKIGVVPDVIIFTWCDFFISPKVVYDLYQQTKAKMVIMMIDAHVLGGGCHYPCGCEQFESGCKNCPALVTPEPAKKLYEEKVKYLSKVPLTIIGTSFDLQRAKKTLFLRHGVMKRWLDVPEVPFVKTRKEARDFFKIKEDDFVILCGAQFLDDRRKGFVFILDALRLFSHQVEGKRNVKILMLGNASIDSDRYDFPDFIDVLQPGFLNKDDLFTAFYAADLFASTSIDDSGPMMINYSVACGTPVISFPVGVAVDLVKHMETGYMAEFMNVEDLAKGISLFYLMDKATYGNYRERCLSLMNQIKKENKPWYSMAI